MRFKKEDAITHSIALLTGQLLSALSVFFWNNEGRHTVTAAVLTILSMVFWSYGFVGLFTLFKGKSPWYARLGLLYALYGCLGGIAFGFEGLYSNIFAVSDKIGAAAHIQHPLAMNLVLFWAGPAFPITLVALGIMFMVKRIGPWWIGLLISLGGLAFPLSRISRIDYIAHMADAVLLIPLICMAMEFMRRGNGLNECQRVI